MNENEIAQQIVDAALRVHMALGPGLLESVYQAALEYELKKRRLRVSPQQAIPAIYQSVRIETDFTRIQSWKFSTDLISTITLPSRQCIRSNSSVI